MVLPRTTGLAPLNWTLRTPSGAVSEWSLCLTLEETGLPYPVSGSTAWEYVARVSSSSSGTPLFVITTSPSEAGLITVSTGSETVVLLTLYPAATAKLSGTYRHTLWSDPGTPGAFSWLTGSLVASPTPSP